MDIKTAKDLEKVIRLCRKLGVDAMEIGNIKFNLGATPQKQTKSFNPALDIPEAGLKIPQFTPSEVSETPDNIKTTDLSDEDLLFYSATDNSQGQQ